MRKQDPHIRADPATAVRHQATAGGVVYLVQSASDPDARYRVTLARGAAAAHRCSCRATVPCNHIRRAELRAHLDRVAAICRRHYTAWGLRELQAEELRLLVIASRVGMGPFMQTQYDAVGDAIAAALEANAAAA